jgi:hypothetical protein
MFSRSSYCQLQPYQMTVAYLSMYHKGENCQSMMDSIVRQLRRTLLITATHRSDVFLCIAEVSP